MTVLVMAAVVGVLVAVGIYLVLDRSLTRIVIGFAMLAHGVNLLLLAAGGRSGAPPLLGRGQGPTADPLPQAFALTALVISFALTAFLLTLAFRSWQLTRDDEVQDDPEDRRIAAIGRRRDEANEARRSGEAR